jgi:hypothetical protein
VGVVGGSSDTTLDPGESLLFRFSSPATAVSYFVGWAFNGDGDFSLGEASVEGYGADGTLLGVAAIAESGPQDVSGLFGNTPLSAFRVHTRDNDRQRISSVSFNAGSGQQTLYFDNQGTYRTARFQQAGVSVTPEVNLPLLGLLNLNGVGVVGGSSDTTLDPGESLLFRFSSPATAVSYFVGWAFNGDGDLSLGEASVEGYGADGTLLGVAAIAESGPQDISGLFGNTPLSAFRVHTRDNDRQRISAVSFNHLQLIEVGPVGLSLHFYSGSHKRCAAWRHCARS